MKTRLFVPLLLAGVLSTTTAAEFPQSFNVELQPLKAQVRRVVEAMNYLGFPLSDAEQRELEAAMSEEHQPTAREGIQRVLDRHALYGVHINPEMRVKVSAGPAKAVLHEQGWVQFLVKVHNESGTTAELMAVSPNGQSLFKGGWYRGPSDPPVGDRPRNQPRPAPVAELPNEDRWLDVQMFNNQPLNRTLSGLELEYRIIQLFSRDAGKREAKMAFNVGQGTQDIGYRNEVDLLFDCQPARPITFRVKDENGKPTTASFE
ncbi:MAG TPA: hypothetical protein DCY13_16100, partial [Verrucomicrobiales bacterium]|nr:hypothetical protein [Verrucomicrobiales bacterium]